MAPIIRTLAGMKLQLCESCHKQPSVFAVTFKDESGLLQITVCYGCRP